ncbi:glycosyltransferase family 4 protein [Nesterenkonia lacusekhoensis]|uniref:Glycosyltransferase involved in cell wall biosynthesis n=1 Tax=Nesterenkonia lacusekhoensis TaxID=150832 RepID=A0ABS4T2E8_9MICC|nr:glycosyltransferase involved in cell wall biosynthesis [Nesterenkonia lacusekhoensis]
MTTLLWVEPDLGTVSGGLRYNEQLRSALGASSVQNPVLRLPGDWTAPLAADGPALAAQVTAAAAGHDADAVVIDGLIGSACPELFTSAAAGDSVPSPARVLLVHLSAAVARELPTGGTSPTGAVPEILRRERLAVEAADHVMTVSRWSADQLRRLYGREDITVAQPGTAAAAPAQPAAPPEQPEYAERADPRSLPAEPNTVPQLACVSAFLPVKNHSLLAPALEPLLDMPWQLTLAGPHSGSAYGQEVIHQLQHRLPGRVRTLGVLSPAEVEQLWRETDLVLLPSAAETYGMVVAEACAAGVPSFIPAGTGAGEAAGEAGVALDPQRPQDWTAALRDWLSSPQRRAELRARAGRRREHLPTWEQAAQTLRSLLAQ